MAPSDSTSSTRTKPWSSLRRCIRSPFGLVGRLPVAVHAHGPDHETTQNHAGDGTAERDTPHGPGVVRREVLDDLPAVHVERRGRVDLEGTAGQVTVQNAPAECSDESSEEHTQQDAERALDDHRTQVCDLALEQLETAVHLPAEDVLLMEVRQRGVVRVVVVHVVGGRVLVVMTVVHGGVGAVVVVVDERALVVTGLRGQVPDRAVVVGAEPKNDPGDERGHDGDDQNNRRGCCTRHCSVPFCWLPEFYA